MGHTQKIVLGVVILVAALGVSIVAFANKAPPKEPEGIVQPQGASPPFMSPAIDGMRIYRSFLLGFELQYPEDLIVREWGEGNTSTISFEAKDGSVGFQVFVAPYDEPTVSAGRFKMDVPSGVIRDQQEITIDGARAIAFISESALLGETRELWFINNGFLYEVTTYSDLDAWLAEIMKSWKFIKG